MGVIPRLPVNVSPNWQCCAFHHVKFTPDTFAKENSESRGTGNKTNAAWGRSAEHSAGHEKGFMSRGAKNRRTLTVVHEGKEADRDIVPNPNASVSRFHNVASLPSKAPGQSFPLRRNKFLVHNPSNIKRKKEDINLTE